MPGTQISLINDYYESGKTFEKSNNSDTALRLYQDAVTKDIPNSFKNYFLAKIDYLKGNYYASIDNFKICISEKVFLNECYLSLADIYFKQKKYNRALYYYEESLELENNEETLLLICLCMLESGEYNKALYKLDITDESIFRNNYSLTKKIAILLFEKNFINQSFKILNLIESLDPEDIEVKIYILKYYKETGYYEKYEKDINYIFNNNPDNYLVCREYAKYHIEKNNNDKALEIYDRLIKNFNTKESLKLKANLYEKLNNISEMIKTLEEYILYEKNDIEIIYKLGMKYFENNEFTKALEMLEITKESNKYGFSSCLMLSEIYNEIKDIDNEIKSLELSIYYMPYYAESYFKLSDIYSSLELKDKALYYLEYAKEVEKNNNENNII